MNQPQFLNSEAQEQCVYCKEYYPKPVSLHHSTEECHENERMAAAQLAASSAEGTVAQSIEKERDGWKDECEHVQRDLANARRELSERRARDRGEVWYWQGDGQDHPESLTCPVIITAEKLRALLAQSAERAIKLTPEEDAGHGCAMEVRRRPRVMSTDRENLMADALLALVRRLSAPAARSEQGADRA